ncbi:MAG TPA: PQQ-dependent sugar dehydrogenase [Solirubrobacterales bacterium]|nr:PQQ-dependent sugar dehydrogenase [Solirubrobacterales bacterium]
MKLKIALAAGLAVLSLLFAAGPAGATVPAGFGDETVFEGLSNPTMVRFAPDGRVFVAEKGGKILVFENLQDETPEVFADLSKPVYDFEDHGLLGIALDPMFDLGSPYVYAIYSFNHELANPATQEPLVSDPEAEDPAWGSAGPDFENDRCPDSEQAEREDKVEEHGCEVSGLVVRMTADGNHAYPSAEEPAQKVLVEGWCQQSTTHSIGDIGFGPEGDLFVSGGEGSMFSKADYGEFGNPCDDPYEEPHGENQQRRSNALGGSLRAQSVLRDHSLPGHETLLSGTVLRIDKATGEGVPGNPLYATSTEKNAKRIIAFGFRQPWRFAFNPRTSKLFVDNVGDGTYEEMDRLELDGAADYGDGVPAYNSGWPCYEGGPAGPHRNEHYTYASEPFPTLQFCIDMYEAEENGEPETSAPFYSYEHSGPIVPDDSCDPAPTLTDIGGISFYEGSNYPAEYKNSLFFADPIRGCIYVMKAGPDGEPDPATVTTFVSGKSPFSFPGVDMEQGPEGDIFYTEFDSGPGYGTVHRITHAPEEKSTPEEPPAEEQSQPPTSDSTSTSPAAGATVETPSVAYAPPRLRWHPAKKTGRTTARFTFQAAAGLTFWCSLDGKAFSRCRSPRIYRHLTAGPHDFRVFAVDSDGKRATPTTRYDWTLKRSATSNRAG